MSHKSGKIMHSHDVDGQVDGHVLREEVGAHLRNSAIYSFFSIRKTAILPVQKTRGT